MYIADLIEENSFEHFALQEDVKAARKRLEEAEEDLRIFEEEHEGMYI